MLPAELSPERLASADDTAPVDATEHTASLVNLHQDILVMIFQSLDHNCEQGCLALALSFKRLASIAVLRQS